MSNIEENLKKVHKNIEDACKKSGRNVGDVVLCAVSKTKPIEDIIEAKRCGEYVFGENYVQEIRDKYEQIDGVKWHMIGHLQKNKVKYIIDKVAMIHSVDSIDLAKVIEKEAEKKNVNNIDILLEVNIACEDTKWGFDEKEVIEAARQIGQMPHITVKGLMTSAPYTDNPETNRVHFKNLKALCDKLQDMQLEGVDASELSMGMTGDYMVAIEEGATIVRVGAGIFGERNYNK